MKKIETIKSLFYAIVSVCIIYLTYSFYNLNNSKELLEKLESNIEIYSKLDQEKHADTKALEFLKAAKDTNQSPELRRALYASALFRATDKDLILPDFIDFYSTQIASLVENKNLDDALDLYTELIDSKDIALQSGTLENVLTYAKYDEKVQALYDSHIQIIKKELEDNTIMSIDATASEISDSIKNEKAILNKIEKDEDRLLVVLQFKQNIDAIKSTILADGGAVPNSIIAYSKKLEGDIESLVKAKQNEEIKDYNAKHKKYQQWVLIESQRLEDVIKANKANNMTDVAEREELENIFPVAKDFFRIDGKYLDPAVSNIYMEAFNKLWKRCDKVKVELSKMEIDAVKLSPKDLQ